LALSRHRPAWIATRLEPDPRGLIAGLKHHRETPGRNIRERLDVRELDAPVPVHIDLGDRTAPTLAFVEPNEAIDEGLARHHLELRIERGAHRQAALVELLLAVALVDVAPNLLGKILGGEDVGAGRPGGGVKWFLLGILAIGCRNVVVLDHAIDNVVAPLNRALALAERVILTGRLRQRGQIRGFRNGELMNRFVEIVQCRSRDPIGAGAKVDLIEIELEDLLLRVRALDAQRQQRLLDLARI